MKSKRLAGWNIVAYVIRDGNKSTAKVPVLFDAIPELPVLIRIKREVFVLTNTNPLTYEHKGRVYPAIAAEDQPKRRKRRKNGKS